MDAIPQSLSAETSNSQATSTTIGLHSPSIISPLSSSNRSASVQPSSLQESTVANPRQASSAGPSSANHSGLESALEGLQVTGQSRTVQANRSSRCPNLEAELEANGFVVLDPHEGEGVRRHYNPDEDEVDSNDGDVVSEDGLELDSDVGSGSDEPFNNSEDNAEVGDEVNEEEEDDDAESESGSEGDGYDDISGANDNDEELNSSQPPVDLDRIGCSNECRKDFRQSVKFYDKQVEALEDRLRALTITNNELRTEVGKANRQIEKLKKERVTGKRTKITWHKELRLFMTNPNHRKAMKYDKIYKLCCKEENMSSKRENVHPNLRLRDPTTKELRADALDGLLVNDAENHSDSEPDNEDIETAEKKRDGPEALFVQDDEQTEAAEPQTQSVLGNFPFAQLPANIQANVLKWIFIQENRLIHCISRLDPYMPPKKPTQTNANRSGLLHRFHLSGTPCNVTYAINPNDHLALLSVCKQWHYLGVHAFYGLNTFAFSSLGEFGRFCTGIGAARRERIQHVELLWMGNQYLTNRPVQEGNDKKNLKWVSKRTWDVSWLCQMRRLKSLVVHVDESSRDYNRRGHEPCSYIKHMASLTAGQPNFRLTRSLRTLQGLDFIHQLRGMEFIQFYDYEMARKDGGRHPIRDWSFGMDVENVTAMPKTGNQAEAAKFENLTPVLRNFVAPDEYLKAVKSLYRHSEAFDAKYVSPAICEEDEDGDIKMSDITSSTQKRKATTARKAASVEHSEGGRKTAPMRKPPAAIEVRDDSEEDGSSSENNDTTPRATVLNARSVSAYSNASIVTEANVANDYDNEGSLVGSNADSPIELDFFEPKKTPRLTKLQHERDIERELSVAVSVVTVSSRESERSFDSGNGLFVRSPTTTERCSQREHTTMTETLRKRGFEDLDIRNAIDLTEADDKTATSYPSSSQSSSSRQMVSQPVYPHITSGSNRQRLASDEDDLVFKRLRRR
ncbi:uncharacterized protein ColSpa_04246 [Colletotrichum spaethianum]|uniref:DUF7730 domain-containing protein n=1 Tax=Colletotrichum spaethianum TaxID=700344 RepID=A0AA37LDM2_9PEZI|nr:uncharacterized protein ColSpa_04246 [Colletotrichum spaethianum]GKT44065.1 hypothetical protein ColSpa_04246 [Colletotrichum spaethianum]